MKTRLIIALASALLMPSAMYAGQQAPVINGSGDNKASSSARPTRLSPATPKLLIDLDSGMVLYSEEADTSWFPASITKLMTANLALNALATGMVSASTPIVMTEHAASAPPSRLGLAPGRGLLLEDALRIMMTRSMNDVAVAIADNLGGSEQAFVTIMNAEATRLGMKGTHFVNASGLPHTAQVSTAEDLAILAAHILKRYPEKAYLFSIPSVTVEDRTFKNTNGLIGRYPGAQGMKTGYVCGSGFNLVAVASRHGRRLLAVVLGAPNPKSREKAAATLLDHGFAFTPTPAVLVVSKAPGPRPATDLSKWACGKSYPRFSTSLAKPARPTTTAGAQIAERDISKPSEPPSIPIDEVAPKKIARRF